MAVAVECTAAIVHPDHDHFVETTIALEGAIEIEVDTCYLQLAVYDT